MMADKLSLSRRWEKYSPSKTLLFWACALCIVATMVVGFGWGGWVTGSTARTWRTAPATGRARKWRQRFA